MWANQRPVHGYVEVNHCLWGLERFTKESLITHLLPASPEGEVISCDFDGPENFDITLQCKLERNQPLSSYGEFAKEWIGMFSNFTRSNWSVKLPMTQKKLVYQKMFICQDCTQESQDNKAKINFRMRLTKKESVSKHNMTITISFHHSHTVYTGEQIDALKVSPETNTKIQRYLEDGCTTSAAKFYHELMLLDEHDDANILNDDGANPPLQHYIYLVNNMKNDGQYPKGYDEIMPEKQLILAEMGTVIDYATNAPYVTIVTPTMRRTIDEFGYHCVYMDTTTIPNGPDVTFLYVPTPIGALPIVCAAEHMPELKFSFMLGRFKIALLAVSCREFKPAAMVFSSSRENKCLDFIQPKQNPNIKESSISKKILSTFEMCVTSWRWLNGDENKIEPEQRHTIMADLSKLLYSDNEDSAKKLYEEMLVKFPIPTLKNHLESLWESHEEWLRDESYIGNNLVEMSIRIMKQLLIQRCQDFNIYVLVDVVAKILENHQRKIIHGYLQNQDMTKMLMKFLSKARVTEDEGKCFFDGREVKKVSDNEYQIIAQTNEKKITFRTDTMLCDCLCGARGELCPHLVAIAASINYFTAPKLSKEDIYRLNHIAGNFDYGEMQPEPKHYPPENDEAYDNLGVRGVAVPLQDARHLLPHLEVSDEEQEPDEDVEMERGLQDLDNFDPRPNEQNRLGIDEFIRLNFRPPPQDDFDNAVIDLFRPPNTSNNTRNRVEPNTIENEYNLVPNNIPLVSNDPSTSGSTSSMRKIYENALKSLHNEFERLSKFFCENPNVDNLKALTRLGAELSKIVPPESAEENMQWMLNDTNMSSSDLESNSS